MSHDKSSFWFYFERVGKTVAKCKIEKCTWSVDQDSQPKLAFQRKAATPPTSEIPEKRQKVADNTLTITQSFTQWAANGQKTKEVDKVLVEMICVDSLPFKHCENWRKY
uniref:Uncharacterized protein n=1 Tax=Meloidogyne floridensis TaxID=298350 RepID=A0A915NIU6_9BILA